jgi:NADH:ubiquinone oxidoreductase subunit 4 (subunit M)
MPACAVTPRPNTYTETTTKASAVNAVARVTADVRPIYLLTTIQRVVYSHIQQEEVGNANTLEPRRIIRNLPDG